MTDKINDFLRETELKKASKGTWGIGTMVTRASAKLVLSLMSVQSATDQILASAAHVVVLGARPDRRCDGHLLQVSRLRLPLRG
jgi:hypothetical protein